MTRLPKALLALLALLIAVAFSAPALAGDAEAGKVTFSQLCWTCHGHSGTGDGPAGAALTPPPRDFTIGDFAYDADGNGTKGEDADLSMVIKQGAAAFGGNPSMAPWGHLSDDDVANVDAYIRSFKK